MATQYIQPTDEQIRTRAYYIWQTDGCPQGRDWEYWLKAKEELERENTGNGSSRKAASTVESRKRPSTRSAVYA